jgi:hypothetical protein
MSGRETRLDRLETAFPAPGDEGRRCRDCGGLGIEELMRAAEAGDAAWLTLLDGATDTCERCGGQTVTGFLAAQVDDATR